MLDDRIESVVFRVEEFKSQLERMHQSLTSAFREMEELHKQMPLLKELFARIEQVEVSTYSWGEDEVCVYIGSI